MKPKRLSISRIKLFKACRKAYEFRYIEGIVPVTKSESLATGANYHEKIEQLYKEGCFDVSDLSKESAMATAYMRYIYHKIPKLTAVEEWVNYDDSESGTHLVGIVDGIAEDGRLVEHKTTGLDIVEFAYNLQWDEQILAYMLMTGARQMYYTICRKPNIRQRKNETDEAFFNRMCDWYETDTDYKIKMILVERTDEEIARFERDLIEIAKEMETAKHENMYRNTCYCHAWGRMCEYAPICLNYDPSAEYIEFRREEV